MTPTWPELVGRNTAAEMISFAGRLISTTPDDGTDVLDFWHGGGGRWRIERDGEVQYINDGERAFSRGRDGRMVKMPDGQKIRLAWVTSGFGPADLVGPDGMLHKMSREVGALTEPAEVAIGDRPAWSTDLGRPGAGPDGRITVSIDAATGVVVSLTSNQDASVAVSGLTPGPIDDERFAWTTDGGSEPRPDPAEVRARIVDRLEILSAVDAGLRRREEVMVAVEQAATVDDARTAVAALLGIGAVGADAVLATQVRRFTRDGRAAIAAEISSLRERLG
ncbi:hypothetical protein [Gordonia humi]|uniref:DNA topoisomerase (ATP-hydrolyzing) n=1 Tax=Gordonia humi TaxID=686429 RepID=A0A840EPV7_9ACTN|nr:hypothetical protein [Gordonia humi]MBB4133521.1 hypothetical protein [Gordonia humi]